MTQANIKSEKEIELKRIMRRLKVFEKDIKEKFVKSSGPGGQNVNKVSTCVMLTHLPSGIQIKCQEARTQALNRYRARYLLVKRIEAKIHDHKVHETKKREKLKRQTRKKPKYLKEAILESKHRNSEKKIARKKIKVTALEKFL